MREMTPEEQAVEFLRCKLNPFYFIHNYVYIEEIGGRVPYSPDRMHPKFRRTVKSLINFHRALLMATRQHGKSTLAAALLEWALNFYTGCKVILFNANKTYALENLQKIKFIHSNLPPWLKVPLKDKGARKTYIEYEHMSKVTTFYPSSTSSPDALARSLSSPVLYIDEAAFIRYMDEIYASAQPTLIRAAQQAARNKYPYFTFITSTPNGTVGIGEWFFNMWRNAIDSDEIFDEDNRLIEGAEHIVNDETKNGFVRVKYHWSENPEVDEEWYKDQCRQLNFDKRRISQELDILFVGSSSCLFSDEFLAQLKPKKPKETIPLKYQTYLKIYREFEPTNFYLVGVDTAKSLTGDWCAIEIFDYLEFNQIAEFHFRLGSVTKFSDIVVQLIELLGEKIIGFNRFKVGIENNSIGNQVVERVAEKYHFLLTNNRKNDLGINTNPKTKDIIVSLGYENLTMNPKGVSSSDLIAELNVIERTSTGKVAAQRGYNDDLFMASCFCAYIGKLDSLDIVPLLGLENTQAATKYENQIVSTVKISTVQPKTVPPVVGDTLASLDPDSLAEVFGEPEETNSNDEAPFLFF